MSQETKETIEVVEVVKAYTEREQVRMWIDKAMSALLEYVSLPPQWEQGQCIWLLPLEMAYKCPNGTKHKFMTTRPFVFFLGEPKEDSWSLWMNCAGKCQQRLSIKFEPTIAQMVRREKLFRLEAPPVSYNPTAKPFVRKRKAEEPPMKIDITPEQSSAYLKMKSDLTTLNPESHGSIKKFEAGMRAIFESIAEVSEELVKTKLELLALKKEASGLMELKALHQKLFASMK
jgi:hypothetical protein